MTKEKAEKKVKEYIVTGFQAPIKVKQIDGSEHIYVEGDKFKETDWPQPKVTIPDAIKQGLVRENVKVI